MFSYLHRAGFAVAVLAFVSLLAMPVLAQSYTVTNIGTPPGTTGATASGINNKGQIVGTGLSAFLWTAGKFKVFPTLGGTFGYGTGVNNNGQVVGYAQTKARSYEGVLYSGSTVTALPFSFATGINDSAQVIGYTFSSATGLQTSFVYQNGKATTLPSLGSSTQPLGINDNGEIVGLAYQKNSGFSDPATWLNGKITTLPTLGGITNYATAVNATGEVAGVSYTPDNGLEQAVIWQNGKITNIDTLGSAGSAAAAINDSGVVVGTADLSSDPIDFPENDAFIYQNGVMTDLNTLVPPGSPALQFAVGINDSGQIVVESENPNTAEGIIYLLTPNN